MYGIRLQCHTTIRLGVLGLCCLMLKYDNRVASTEDLHVELQQLTAPGNKVE
jgi:hypothetical protein